jgi:hypothetical protein
MQDNAVIQRAPGAVEAKVDDQVVLLSPLDFSYHALDPIGAQIWALLGDPLIFNDLIAQLVETFSVDEKTCRADVTPFINRMTEIGVLTSS